MIDRNRSDMLFDQFDTEIDVFVVNHSLLTVEEMLPVHTGDEELFVPPIVLDFENVRSAALDPVSAYLGTALDFFTFCPAHVGLLAYHEDKGSDTDNRCGNRNQWQNFHVGLLMKEDKKEKDERRGCQEVRKIGHVVSPSFA